MSDELPVILVGSKHVNLRICRGKAACCGTYHVVGLIVFHFKYGYVVGSDDVLYYRH